IVPLRARRLTGIVTAVGEALDSGGAAPKPILELPEALPLYDDAHLRLIEFMASYYMAPIGEAMRSVIPALARIESRKVYRLAAPPDPLRRATMSAVERAIVNALARRAISALLGRLVAEGMVEAADATRGRHREALAVRLAPDAVGAAANLRGARQRAVLEALNEVAPEPLALDELEERIAGARAIVHALRRRGLVAIESASVAGALARTDSA